MKKILFIPVVLFLFSTSLKAQNGYYLEDQIFIGGTYNILFAESDSISQGGFSNGINFGYIRDIPFNSRRNFGVGLGLGYSSNHFYQNVSIATLNNGVTSINLLAENSYIRNKFTVNYLEFPFEIRYRTSTFEEDTFFRLYLGVKAGYKLRSYSKLKTQITEIAYYNQPEFNWWRYGLTLTVGYGAWNIYMYYGLNDIFKDGTQANPVLPENELQPMNMNELNIGILFYLI